MENIEFYSIAIDVDNLDTESQFGVGWDFEYNYEQKRAYERFEELSLLGKNNVYLLKRVKGENQIIESSLVKK